MNVRRVPNVVIVNPLGVALAHYQKELEQSLRNGGFTVDSIAVTEPSSNGHRRLAWVFDYLRALIAARKTSSSTVVVAWPALGYFDFALAMILGLRRAAIIIHDPTPLVGAIGYSNWAKALARYATTVRAIAHSDSALEEVQRDLGRSRVTVLPHPILMTPAQSRNTRTNTIRVLGQYKKSRDIDAMRRISNHPPMASYSFEIVGRGWPPVDGWSVRDEFVPETQLDELLSTSAAVVIPYTRFYQSGIAIRALENLTPVVGPAGTSLDEIFGESARNLVRSDWTTSMEFALTLDGDAMAIVRDKYTNNVRTSASSYVAHGTRRPTNPVTERDCDAPGY